MKTCRTSTLSLTASIAAGMAITLGSHSASAAINEGFTTMVPLPAGWTQQNLSTPPGTNPVWFQGNTAVFTAQAGATNSYAACNFNSVAGTNTISNWLITPTDTLQAGGVISFWTRTVTTVGYPDRLQLRMSLNGASGNVGLTANDVGDFTTLLVDVNPTLTLTGYPSTWTLFTHTLTAAEVPSPTTGRFAFRYFVTGGGPTGSNSDFIGVDTVSYIASDCLAPLPAGCRADVSSTTVGTPDNKVDVSDLVFIITNWGASGPPRPAADISSTTGLGTPDCTVNVSDLLGVITSWGDCTGGCCVAGNCQTLSSTACATAGGVYAGNGLPCSGCVFSLNGSDSCAAAPDITSRINVGPIAGTTVGSTPAVGPDAELPVGSPSCQWQTPPTPTNVHNTVWYKFTAPASGNVTVATCSSSTLTDSIVGIYSGTCGGLVEMACGEDDCGTSTFDSIATATGLTPGSVYFVLIASPGGWTGSVAGAYQVDITSP